MTKEITIQGHAFSVATPYAEGHTVTEAEAKALNQTRSEAIRNNMARVIKQHQDEEGNLSDESLAEVTAAVKDYDDNYEFTLATAGGGRKTTDPVEAEALRMSRAAISAQLKDAGRKVKDIDKDALAGAIAKLAETPGIMKAAAKAVKDRQTLAEGALDSLDL